MGTFLYNPTTTDRETAKVADWGVDTAVCENLPQFIFFEDIWPDSDDGKTPPPVEEALARGRRFCASCPVRVPCLLEGLRAEEQDAARNRYGLRGFLTPQQRASVEKRGGLPKCCGEYVDPIAYADGNWTCPKCGTLHRSPRLPDDGDGWNARHSRLAVSVVRWIVEEIEVGRLMPPPSNLAAEFEVRKADMVRVYTALVDDGTLSTTREGRITKYTRVGQLAAQAWRPVHLPV